MAGLELLAAVNLPTAIPWEWLINIGFTFIGSIAVRIIFLTICIKLVLLPLDFYQRYKMRKNQLITERLKPQMDDLEKRYAGNDTVLQQKKQALNKKSGMSMLSSCLPMIVTMVVFIWLWQSLNNIAQYNQFVSYVELYDTFSVVYQETAGDVEIEEYAKEYTDEFNVVFLREYASAADPTEKGCDDAAVATAVGIAKAAASLKMTSPMPYDALYRDTFIEWYVGEFTRYLDVNANANLDTAGKWAFDAGSNRAIANVQAYCTTIAQNETYNYYFNEGDYAAGGSKEGQGYQMQSFLWIKNVWTADVWWSAPIKSSEAEFKSAVGGWATDPKMSGMDRGELDRMVSMYDTVTARIQGSPENSTNGYLFLPVLALLLNIVSQLISRRQQKKSGLQQTEGQAGCMMKAMLFIMPAMMFYFALSYCSAFTLYIVTNTLMSLLITLGTSLITSKMLKKDAPEKVVEAGGFVEKYGRPDPNAKKTTASETKDPAHTNGKKAGGYNKGKNNKKNKR